MPKSTNLLITDGTSYRAAVVARFIKSAYSKVCLMMMSGRKLARVFHTKHCDNFLMCPFSQEKDSEAYIAWLQKVIRDHQITWLLPISQREMGFFLSHKEMLFPCLDYWGTPNNYRLLNNKRCFNRLCQDLGISVPETYDVREIETRKGPCDIVVKPTEFSGSKNVIRVRSYERLQQCCNQYAGELIVQDFFPGTGGGLSVFASSGSILEWYAHERILEFRGSTMRRTLRGCPTEPILRSVARLVEATNWSGFCMFEFRFNKSGYAMLEANPRIWGSIGQGLSCGINFLSPILGQPDRTVHVKESITFLSPEYLLSTAYALAKFELSVIKKLRYRCKAVPDISFWRDPLGYVGQFIR